MYVYIIASVLTGYNDSLSKFSKNLGIEMLLLPRKTMFHLPVPPVDLSDNLLIAI